MVKKSLILGLFFSTFAYCESRDVIALVDTGKSIKPSLIKYYCKLPAQDFTGKGIIDHHGHGTQMALLIAKNIDPEKTCILSVKWWDNPTQQSYTDLKKVVSQYSEYLLELKPKYINFSLSGTALFIQELKAFRKLIKQNTYVVVAAGNEGYDLSKNCMAYPACYLIKDKHFRVVGGRSIYPAHGNYNGPINSYENFEQYVEGQSVMGTSAATAFYTGKLASGKVNP